MFKRSSVLPSGLVTGLQQLHKQLLGCDALSLNTSIPEVHPALLAQLAC